MATNFSVYWKPFKGYFLNLLCYGTYHIHTLMFYDKEGNTVNVPLSDGVQFCCSLKGDINIAIRKKVNYTRNEIFLVKSSNKFCHPNEYDAYVPIEPSELTYLGSYSETSEDGNIISHYKECSFNGSNLQFWGGGEPSNAKILKDGENRLKMVVYTDYEYTDKKKKLDKLSNEISNLCGVHIYSYDLEKILEHYKITKKRK